jgi:hypothetical protein
MGKQEDLLAAILAELKKLNQQVEALNKKIENQNFEGAIHAILEKMK